MRKQVKWLAVLSLAMLLAPALALGQTTLATRDLIAGKNGPDVGDVTVVLMGDGDTIKVMYTVDPPWCLTETHADVQVYPTAPPGPPGQMAGNHDPLPCVMSDEHSFSLAGIGGAPGDMLNVAAHAVVLMSDNGLPFNGICPDLTTASETVVWPGNATGDYFDVTLSDAGPFNGLYGGWCADASDLVRTTLGPVKVVCSYAPEAANVIEQPQNLDLVNYLLNNRPGGATRSDIQEAIWRLLWDPTPRIVANLPPGEPFDETTVQGILAMVTANGEGYMPGPGDVVVVILVQVDNLIDCNKIGQNHLIPIPIPRTQDETAWAQLLPDDAGNPTVGWGTYFTTDPVPNGGVAPSSLGTDAEPSDGKAARIDRRRGDPKKRGHRTAPGRRGQ